MDPIKAFVDALSMLGSRGVPSFKLFATSDKITPPGLTSYLGESDDLISGLSLF